MQDNNTHDALLASSLLRASELRASESRAAEPAVHRASRVRWPLGMRPEEVPVLAIDDGLPMIPSAQQSIAALRKQFEANPVWTPEWVHEGQHESGIIVPIQAAVLIPIVIRPEPAVILTRRSAKLKTHAGQVAFPGGKLDPLDANFVAAALREAAEEVALPPTSVEVLGQLPSYVTGTGFEVTPVVGLIPDGLVFQPNPGEVDEVFEVPLSFLLNPANHRHHAFLIDEQERKWLSMPYAIGEKEHYIWGVTASIIRNLYRFLQAPQSL